MNERPSFMKEILMHSSDGKNRSVHVESWGKEDCLDGHPAILATGNMKGNGMWMSPQDARAYAKVLLEAADFAESSE